MSICPTCHQVIPERCSRCHKDLRGWEDHFASGNMFIRHSSVVGELMTDRHRENMEKPPVLSHHGQKVSISWGNDTHYKLCWSCSRELLKTLGSFFRLNESGQ